MCTATRLCTALLYCVMLCSLAALGLVASHYVVVQCCYIVRSLVCRGVTSTSKNSLLSRFKKSFGYRLYRLYMLSFLSVYQIIIMKNVYRIFQFGVTGHLQILSDSNRTQLNLSVYLNLALIWCIPISQICRRLFFKVNRYLEKSRLVTSRTKSRTTATFQVCSRLQDLSRISRTP